VLHTKPIEASAKGFMNASGTTAEPPSHPCAAGGALPVPIRAADSLPLQDALPLFEMLTAPFVMLSGVGTADVALAASNTAAETLLKGHTAGALTGFRVFVPPNSKLASDDPQSCEAARWFQEVAVGMKAASAAQPSGGAVDASVEWLCGPGRLREVSLGQAAEGKQSLLAALQQGDAPNFSGGEPIVVVDVPSGTVFGAHASRWQQSTTSTSKFVSVILTYNCFEVRKWSARRKSRKRSKVSNDFSKSGMTSTSFCSFSFEDGNLPPHVARKPTQPSTSAFVAFTVPPNNEQDIYGSNLEDLRGSQVDWVTLSSLKQRLELGCNISGFHIAPHLPSRFIINDYLILHVLQEVLQYNKRNGLAASKLFIHRCGMHLVVDLVPQHMVPHVTAANAAFQSVVRDFYEQQEARMHASHLFSTASDVFSESPFLTTCHWVDSILATSGSAAGGRRHVCDLNSLPEGGNPFAQSGDPTSSGVFVASADGKLPSVWSVQLAVEGEEQTIVEPTQYLSARICELLVSIKAAVVVSSTGAATIAFPYITQDRVDLLKEVNLVHQPVVDASELGIEVLNRMAERAALEREDKAREKEKRGTLVPLNYGSALKSVEEKRQCVESAVVVASPLHFVRQPTNFMSNGDIFAQIKEEEFNESENPSQIPISSKRASQSFLSPHASGVLVLPVGPPLRSDTVDTVSRNSFTLPPYNDVSSPNAEKRLAALCTLTDSIPQNVDSAGTVDAIPFPSFTETVSPVQERVIDLQALNRKTAPFNPALGEAEGNASYVDYKSFRSAMPHIEFPCVRILFYLSHPMQDLLEWLVPKNYTIIMVCNPDQMTAFLKCGIEVYDLVVMEWSSQIITPEIQEQLKSAQQRCSAVPIFLGIFDPSYVHGSGNEGFILTDFPPLPPNCCIFYGTDMYSACLLHQPAFRSKMRLGRILKDLKGDDTEKYQIRRRIGSGSFGDVYEVAMYASKGRLAMKRIPLGTVTTERMEALYNETAIMRELDHRNIVQLSRVSICDDTYLHIFMELCDYTLKDVLDEVTLSGGFLVSPAASCAAMPFGRAYPDDLMGQSRAASIQSIHAAFQQSAHQSFNFLATFGIGISSHAQSSQQDNSQHHRSANSRTHEHTKHQNPVLLVRDVLSAVQYLHSHDIVHRDLKPQNILFLNGVAKLADFGTATTASARQKPLHTMKGTIPYMAPEVFLGEPYRTSCDVWSLGILIGEILGMRFAHTTLLHYPSLNAYFRSFDKNESMPIVVTNYVETGLKKHLTDDLVSRVTAILQEARIEAKADRALQAKPSRAKAFLGGGGGSIHRTVFAIEVDQKLEQCAVTRHSLSASLVELLESTFYRNPEKRVTAEQLLEHPIVNERERMTSMIAEVAELNRTIRASSSKDEQSGIDGAADAKNWMSFSECGGSEGEEEE